MERILASTAYFENCSNYYHIRFGDPVSADQIQHQIDYYEVCFVIKGQLVHQHGSVCVTLEEGDCFIIPPGFLHSTQALCSDAECFWLSFQESLLFPGYQHNNLYKLFGTFGMDTGEPSEDIKLKFSLPQTERENLRKLLECLLYEQDSVVEQESNAAMLTAAIVSTIARNYFDDSSMLQKLDRIDEYSTIMLSCIRYIDENYMNPLTIAHMAKQFGISASVFGVMFPKVAGVPFKQYLNRKRISAAVALCADQTLPFHKIADICGYGDTSTFYRNFIKYMGVSPTSFRDKITATDKV